MHGAIALVPQVSSFDLPGQMEISMTDQRVTPIILCGGAGMGLWNSSREKLPKYFVPLIGNLTTFQQVCLTACDPAYRVAHAGYACRTVLGCSVPVKIVIDSRESRH
jgi:hypothetical protein